MQDSEAVIRARFWRRLFAFIIDGLLISLVLGLVGLLLFAPTNGRVRVSTLPIFKNDCSVPTSDFAELHIPPDFHITNAARCTKSLLGHVFDRTLTVAEVTRSGSVTYTRSFTAAIDIDGHPIAAFYLDYMFVIILAAYLVVFEWRRGATVGQDLLGMHVQSLGGGPLTFTQAAKRLIMRYVPFAPFIVANYLAMMVDTARLFELLVYFSGAGAISVLLSIVFLLNFIFSVRRGQLPWHDRWATSEVVRKIPAD
jgi:uncharacterized RDD family membrane protein YckC